MNQYLIAFMEKYGVTPFGRIPIGRIPFGRKIMYHLAENFLYPTSPKKIIPFGRIIFLCTVWPKSNENMIHLYQHPFHMGWVNWDKEGYKFFESLGTEGQEYQCPIWIKLKINIGIQLNFKFSGLFHIWFVSV